MLSFGCPVTVAIRLLSYRPTSAAARPTPCLLCFTSAFGVRAQDLPGTEAIFQAANLEEPPQDVKTVVLVGNKISPGQRHHKKDGTVVQTLWGEIAWQLGGKEGYELLREADETATNPGDALKDLFNRYGPLPDSRR